ncbi:MAG: hypothetical protein ACREA0_14200, partial [bacterium]
MSIDIDYALAIGLPAWTNADGVIGDTFNRVDSATDMGSTDIGGTHVWNQRVGTWGISGNQAYTSVSTIRSVATVGPTTVEDGLISVVLGQVGAVTHGIVFRWVDTDNYLLMRANGDLLKRDAGALSLLKASSVLEAGLWLVHFNEGRIRVENGANGSTRLEHTLTLAEHDKYKEANIHGLYINESTTVRFDDFRIEGLQVQSPAPRSVSIRRGRSRRYDPVAPAEAVVVLDNESGDLDPANPNGKHYPRLRKDTLILLRYNTGSANLLTRLQSYDIIDASHWRSVSNTTLSIIAFTT